MVTASVPVATPPRRHRPAVRDIIRARFWCVATLAAVALSFVVGDGVATALGVQEGTIATPNRGAAVLLVLAALVLPPLALTWRHALRVERDGGRGARVTAVVASAAAGGFLVLNVSAWLVALASWAVNRL